MRTRFKFDIPIEEFPDAIFCADLHIRDTTPTSRKKGFLDQMVLKLSWLQALQKYFSEHSSYPIPVICAGDVFETWKTKDWWTIGKAMELLPEPFYCVAGQHELPRHSLEFPERSPLSILHKMGRVFLVENVGYKLPCFESSLNLYGKSWGASAPTTAFSRMNTEGWNILVTHEMIWDKKPYPGAPSEGNVKQVFDRYSDYDVIVSGDNHQPFVKKKGSQLLVNCGSMMRSSISQADYRPCVWLYYADEQRAESLEYPIQEDVFVEYEILEEKEDEKIRAVVQKMKEGMSLDVSFEENLQRYIQIQKPRKQVQEILLETIGV